MKIIILLICSFNFSFASAAEPLSRQKIYELVKDRLVESGHSKQFVDGREYYHFSFETQNPRDYSSFDKSASWSGEEILYFSNPQGKVSQVALISKQCGIEESLETKRSLKQQTLKLVDRESENLFGEKLTLSDENFKTLGPHFQKMVRVPIKSVLPGTKKIRLSRGPYKCDGKRGFGYRVDFFL